MSRISESIIGDEFSDPMEYTDQPGKKGNRKPSFRNIYDEDDDEDEEDFDEDEEDDEEFEEEDDDE
jgi:hypothetical protein